MQREMTRQALEFEGSAASGFAMAQNEKYRRQRVAERAAEWRKVVGAPANTGKPNLSGWKQLQLLTEQIGGQVQYGGERFVQA